MAPQPGIVEAFLAQLGNMTTPVETPVLPAYGTDREVYEYFNGAKTKNKRGKRKKKREKWVFFF
jgi:hypothetical protein